MKKLHLLNVLLFGIFILSFNNVVYSQVPAINKEIEKSIKSANAKELAKSFNDVIDINLPDYVGVYAKNQAEVILKEFFTKNPPISFNYIHNGSSKDGSIYFIGTYKTSANNQYRTSFLLKKTDDIYFIHQLRFEIDNIK